MQVSALAPFGLAGALPLGDVRPKWASSVQPWWDLDCDRDLLLGTFLHGFGAYPKMKQDPRLCFTDKVRWRLCVWCCFPLLLLSPHLLQGFVAFVRALEVVATALAG